jgi:hypothetical protein
VNYLSIHKSSPFTIVRVSPIEPKNGVAWPLDTAQKILFVNAGLPRLLKNSHVGGTFQSGASYALDLDEIQLIVSSKLGAPKNTSVAFAIIAVITAIAVIGFMIFGLLWTIFVAFTKFLLVVVFVPFAMAFFKKRR